MKYMDMNLIMLNNFLNWLSVSGFNNLHILESIKIYLMMLPSIALVQCLIVKNSRKLDNGYNLHRVITVQIFCFLCVGILTTTGVPNIKYIIAHKYSLDLDIINYSKAAMERLSPITAKLIYLFNPAEIHINPYRMYFNDQMSYILNVILFVPFGFLFSALSIDKSKIGWKRIALIGFLFSFSIEFMQLFNRRTTDLDDLITNTFGAVLGFIIYIILYKKKKLDFITNIQCSGSFLTVYECEIYLVLIYILWLLNPV